MTPPCRRTLMTMRCFRQSASDLWHETSGAVALEYGLIASLIIVAILGAIAELGDTLLGLPLQAIADALAGIIS
ncbi:MAG: hypothetical protein AAF637_07335 [Pseudomonadota bacterium]